MKLKNILLIMILLLSGCVSVKIGGAKGVPATGISLEAPAAPFKEIKSSSADRAWLSDKTGNTISYFSECGNPNDPSLATLESDALTALNDYQTLKSQDLTFNERAARQTTAHGQVDGVDVQLMVVVFKRNSCNYTVSYGGVQKNFDKESGAFQKFLSKFKAP
jgi:hypothetical protein